MKRVVLPVVLTVLTATIFTGTLPAQGIIVNEISQGPAGAQEFIELLVVGSATQASGTVDLRDWIIDDNNGDFQLTGGVAPGIANGHFRFAPSDTLAAVPIGALIVIYNAADVNPAWTFRQLDINGQDVAHIENGGFTYYIPGTSSLLRACSGSPNATSTSYTCTAGTIPPLGANWTGQIGLANNGDAIQVRRPDGTFFHGFGFSTPTVGNVFTVFPTFAEVSLSSFNGYAGTAANTVVYFDCGSYYFSSHFLNAASASETPGNGNTTDNIALINNIRAGLFQYSLLGTDVPCQQILPVTLLYFKGALAAGEVNLEWSTASETDNLRFTIQRSSDQKSWTAIGTVPGSPSSQEKRTYRYTDAAPLPGASFYRLEQEDRDGKKHYSVIVPIRNGRPGAYIYPNPAAGDRCNILVPEMPSAAALYDIAGRQVYRKKPLSTGNTISLDLSAVPQGLYYVKLYFQGGVTTLRLVRSGQE
ncbi:T9SS type A sorting domain-containing protein [Taibaiella helva]|uniref:T9SS type A sorting domain-containing protein n=1 Tax=Taibaiella helva TaxID=2301235 RepID=UPI000E586AED|nr:T9SS type A sorting domain-containing protein [Taibaiella helva]